MHLLDHQLAGLDRLEGFNRCAFVWDMGTGKTFAGAEKLYQLRAVNNIIVCQKSMIKTWLNHFLKFYGEYYIINCICDLTDKNGLQLFLKMKDVKYGMNIGIINYDILFRRPALKNIPDLTLMLDESSIIQNESTARAKFIMKMQHENVILLTGTPVSGKYENLYTQMCLLGYKLDKNAFYNMYINYHIEKVGRNHREIDGYKNVDHLKKRLRSLGCDFLKTSDVITLPQQNFIDIHIPCTKQYKTFIKDKIVTVEDTKLIGDTRLTEYLYARQLASVYNPSKLDAYVDLLNSTSDGFVVFYNFTVELEKLLSVTHDRPVSIVNGSMKDLTAYEENDNAIVFVQYQAGSMGLNLQKYNRVIYFSPTNRSELYEQSKKRIHRIGTTKPCFYYLLKCAIEYNIYDTLDLRRDYTDLLFEQNKTHYLV